VNHTALLVDENDVPITGVQPVATPFKVKLPKLYWPNSEISNIRATVTVTLHDADGNPTPLTQTITVTQNPLISAGLNAANYSIRYNSASNTNQYGSLTGATTNYSPSPHYGAAIRAAFTSVTNGPPSPSANTTYLHGYAYLITNGTASTPGWNTMAAFRTSKDAITVAAMESDQSQTNINGTNSVLHQLEYRLTTSTGTTAASLNTASANTRIYKFLVTNGKNTVPSTITFVKDTYATEATQLPSTAVPIIKYANNNNTLLAVDPANKLIYIGDLQAVGSNTGWAANPGRKAFLDNLVLYIKNAAAYGSHFTDMLNESMINDVDDPWDAAWGNNCAEIIPAP
jgi:hypothetical protein